MPLYDFTYSGAPIGTRNTGQDFNTLDAGSPGNQNPYGLWSNGTTMWVADFNFFNPIIFAYNLSDKARDATKDFTALQAAGNGPAGIWSNGTTMWAADFHAGKIFAYNMSDKARDEGREFNTLSAAGNTNPTGIWSDGTTMWVANSGSGATDKIFAYNLSDKARDETKDFNTLSAATNNDATGIWSDGTTMWVADSTDDKIYAYNMSDKARDATKDFDLDAGNTNPTGLWGNATTMWVSNDPNDNGYKVFAYDFASDEIKWRDRDGSAPAITATITQGALNNAQTAEAASTTENNYRLQYDSALTGDARLAWVRKNSLTAGKRKLAYSTEETPPGIVWAKSVAEHGDRRPDLDFNLNTSTLRSGGIHIDGIGRMFATGSGGTLQFAAYNVSSTGTYGAQLTTLATEIDNTRKVRGVWTNATHVYPANTGIFNGFNIIGYRRYNISATGNVLGTLTLIRRIGGTGHEVAGLWSDGTTMWLCLTPEGSLAHPQRGTVINAYELDSGDNINGGGVLTPTATKNITAPCWDIHGDGSTLWVNDGSTIRAYNISSTGTFGTRITNKEFALNSLNSTPRGISVYNNIMYVTNDDTTKKVFAYTFAPPA